jgi:hypothetical protein
LGREKLAADERGSEQESNAQAVDLEIGLIRVNPRLIFSVT